MRVIIFGSNSATSLGLVRCMRDCEITLLYSNEFSAAKYSKFVSKKMFYKNLDKQLCEDLINSSELHGCHIFPSSDENLNFILSYQNELSAYFEISSSKFGLKILNKLFQKKYARLANLKVPRKIELNNVQQKDFPIIVKPTDSLKYGKEYFQVIHNENEYEFFLKNINREINFFAEEFIAGGSDNMYELIGYFDYKKNLFGHFGIKKKRQFPPVIGSSSYVESFHFPNEITHNLSLFFSEIEYRGLFDAEFKFCSTRKAYFFIECNFRAGAPISFTETNNFSLLNNFLRGISYSYKSDSKSYWMNDQIDYVNLKYDLSFIHFTRNVISANRFAFYDRRDLKPFYKMLLKKVE